MKTAIIGSGDVGTALARLFARRNLEVTIANSRGPESLEPLRKELGLTVVPASLQDAARAETIILAVPFPAHRAVAKASQDWSGRIVVDATNTLDNPEEEVAGLVSSEIVARAFVGARVVKAFNHLPARLLGANPLVAGQRQAIFVSSDDAEASATVAALAEQLGFAPVELGPLAQGGAALHSSHGQPGGLLFQNLAKLD